MITCEENDVEKELETPPKKKLKQARLPFQVLIPGSAPPNLKKRKNSEDCDDIKVLKIVKPNGDNEVDAKENLFVTSSQQTKDEETGIRKAVECVDLIDENSLDSKVEGNASEESIELTKTAETIEESSVNLTDKSSVNPKVDASTSKRSTTATSEESTEFTKTAEESSVNLTDQSSVNPKVDASTSKRSTTATKEGKETSDKIQKTDATAATNSENKEETEDENREKENVEVETKDVDEDSDTDAESNKDIKTDVSDEGRKESELDSSSTQSDSEPENDVDSTPEHDEPSESTGNPNSSENEKETIQSDHNPCKEEMDDDGKKDCERTPKRGQSGTPNPRKLTPKQVLLRQESAKKREEREKQKLEKEKKRAAEKEEKQKMRLERREKQRKEREEREEQKKKEKEEKEKKKQAELELKLEEKRMKEEERKKKEEERRVKEEQRLLEKKKKDEEKLAKVQAQKKVAAAFVNFFVPKSESKSVEETKEQNEEQQFMPFQVKVDMRLAPINRRNFDVNHQEKMDKILSEQLETSHYLKELKKESYTCGKCGSTWSLSEFQNEVVIIEDDEIPVTGDNEVMESHPSIAQPKMKLLQFSENRRPPYWGTWKKRSKSVKPRCPFGKDDKHFDYEVDSDDEWEEEEPGESLHGSDDEKEKESEDEYEVDNEFFVPHGYLSEEENDCEGDESFSPETQKAKLKLLELEFEEEMKHKTERIKPRLMGCHWASDLSGILGASEQLQKLFSSYRAVFIESPIVISCSSASENGSPSLSEAKVSTPGSARRKFPESAVPSLIRLVHGNINGRNYLVKEFLSHLSKEEQAKNGTDTTANAGENMEPATENPRLVSKLRISKKIKEIASWVSCPEDGPYFNRMCWFVPSEIRAAYGLEDLPVHHQSWVYINKPKREVELSNNIPSPSISNEFNPRQKSAPLITKFTKKLSPEELQKQLQQENDLRLLNEARASDRVSSPKVNSSARGNNTGELQDKKSSKTLPLITKFTKKIDRDKLYRQKPVDDEIQIIEEQKSSSSQTNGDKSDKAPECTSPFVLPTKNDTKTSQEVGQVSSLGKLIQTKAKPSECKRIKLLMSVPLGQKIPPVSILKPVNQDVKENQSNESAMEGVISGETECIVLSD